MRTSDKPRETEMALVIRSPRAEQIADEIARLETLGRYRLTPPRWHRLRDVYFDTPDGTLTARRLALRIRAVAGKQFVTLKESLGHEARGTHARTEIELTWSRAAFTRIARELRARGIALKKVDAVYQRDDPVKTLQRAGLRVIQDRLTQRRARNVLGTGRRVRAELAIDTTTFFFGKQVVHLYEVEIEAKSAHVRVSAMAQRLEKMFAPALQRWFSKLATGKIIQTLLQQGILQKLLDEQNHLTPAALDRIEQEWRGASLRRHRCPQT
jgi:inorganic triphosphatase YgiF